MEERIWKSQNGRETRVEDMNTRHIENTLAKLKREGFVSPKTVASYVNGPKPNGDSAQDAFDEELDRVLNSPVSPFIDWFEEELEKRNNLAISREEE